MEHARSMAAKYAHLRRVIARPEAQPVPELREAAARWPGALREGQLVAPGELARRERRCAEVAACESRAHHRSGGRAFMVLWSDLHHLLGAGLSWRRAGGVSTDLTAFLVEAQALPGGWLWPADAEGHRREAGARVKPRAAYRVLATRAGLTLPELNWILFARRGHWDHRPEDDACP